MSMMFYLILTAILVALYATFILLLCYKLGIVEWLQVHGNSFVSKLAHCDFCMSWWLCLLITIVILGFTGDLHLLCVPIIATPIARRLL